MRMRWAVYISSRRDFSQLESRRAAAQETRDCGSGHEKRRRFEPAVFRVRTFEYFFGGCPLVAGTVTEPRTVTN
jgi:hypothetical protein